MGKRTVTCTSKACLTPTRWRSFRARWTGSARCRDGNRTATRSCPSAITRGWTHAADLDPSGFMDRRDLLTYNQAFIDLIDGSPVFDYIVDVMGPYILLSMTQAVVRAASSAFQGYIHTDGGESLRRTRVGESSPPIAMKAMYLLTDVHGENCGNLTVFPGSHLRQIPYGRRAQDHALFARRRPAYGQGGRCLLVPARVVARPCAQRIRSRPQVSAVQLLPALGAVLRLRCHSGHFPALHAAPATAAGGSWLRLPPRSYFYVPKDQVEVIQNAD